MDTVINFNSNKFLSILFNTEYDATNKTHKRETFLKIDVTALRSGLLHHIKGSELTVLLAIASFMDNDGVCYPTQRQISDITGISLPTVNKAISNLLNIRINDMPVLERKLRGSGQKKNSIYTIFDISPDDHIDDTVEDPDVVDEALNDHYMDMANEFVDPVTCGTNQEETVEDQEDPVDVTEEIVNTKPMNSKDYAHYFAQKFKLKYDKSYVITYKRDLGLIKNKLMKNYSQEDILAIIDVAIDEYPDRWSNSKYPTPTIGMLCGWLCNEVVKILIKKEAETKKANELIDATADYIDADYSDFMDL